MAAAAAGLSPQSVALAEELAHEILAAQQRMQVFSDGVDTIRDGFALFDADLRLLSANRSFRSFFGSVIGCEPGVSLHHLVQGVERHHLIDFQGLSRREWRDQIILSNGVPNVVAFADGRKYRWYSKPDARGNLVCLASDISAEINRQNELAAAQQAAEQAGQAKTRFLTHMSHELRTPLNGVLGMAELLCDAGLDGESQLFAETIRSSAEALLRIVNEVLEFTRGQAQGTSIACQSFDLETLAADTVTLLYPNAAAKGLGLSLVYDPLAPRSYRGDAGRLRQIILNLLGNGIKYTPAGAVCLRILRQRDQVMMLVEDSGPGIPEDKADTIFEEFSQLGEPASAHSSGSGLGLAITAQLVQAMGGQLWQTNLPGGGACFGVSLPLEVEGKPPGFAGAVVPGSQLLMIVQPDPGMRRNLRRMLRVAGLSARFVPDAEAAAVSIRDRGRARWIVLFDCNLSEPPEIAQSRLSPAAGEAEFWLAVNATRPTSDTSQFARVLRLPLTRQALDLAITDALASDPRATAAQQRQMTVLVADDNATNRLIVEKMLSDCTLTLLTAENGQQAVDMWRTHRPDLILMDISMPVMDGRQASQMIRQVELANKLPRTSIVAVTADLLEQDGHRATEAGMNEVVVKPVRRAMLLDLILRYAPDNVTVPVPAGAA